MVPMLTLAYAFYPVYVNETLLTFSPHAANTLHQGLLKVPTQADTRDTC